MDFIKLGKRAERFNIDIKFHEAMAVQNSEQTLVDLNRKQMMQSKTAKGEKITPKYSPNYAAKKGKSNPDLFVTGDFQGEMFLSTNENEGIFFISSFDWKIGILVAKYTDNIFGIMPKNEPKATKEASKELLKIYKREVWIN